MSKNILTIFKNIKTPNNLLEYLCKTINYGFVTYKGKKYLEFDKDFLRYFFSEYKVQNAYVTLLSGVGTCWDLVEVERQWFSNHNFTIRTFFMYFKLDKQNNYPCHTFLVFIQNKKYFWFEYSWGSERGIHEYNTLNHLINDVKQKHLNATIKDFPNQENDLQNLIITEYLQPKPNLSAFEYLEFVQGNEYK